MRLNSGLAACLVLPLLALIGAAPAAAETKTPEAAPRIQTVLDVSGSMAASDIGGGTRMEAAKDAMYTLVDSTPSSIEMGVRLYGSEYPGKSKATGCKDTRLISPVAAMDAGAKTAVKKKIAATKPTGFTPIGHSLRTAVKDLGTEGKRRIILVSDGEDTCAPPEPCEIAKELAGAGVDLAVDTLGFKVKGKAAEQLKCIARVTKGTYRSAEDATELSAGLQGALRQGLKGYQASGTPVKGGTSCATAPKLTAGQYVDHLATDRERWYRLNARPGQSARFGATLIPQEIDSAKVSYVRVTLSRPKDVEDGEELADSSAGASGGWGTVRSTGTETDRLGWADLSSGSSTVPICAKVLVQHHLGNPTEAVELQYSLAGRPLTRADLKNPKAAAKAGDDATLETAAPDSKRPSRHADSSDRTRTAASASKSSDTGFLIGAIALGLLLGTGIRIMQTRATRRTR
jgi:Ca-activated chloride channel family protein